MRATMKDRDRLSERQRDTEREEKMRKTLHPNSS